MSPVRIRPGPLMFTNNAPIVQWSVYGLAKNYRKEAATRVRIPVGAYRFLGSVPISAIFINKLLNFSSNEPVAQPGACHCASGLLAIRALVLYVHVLNTLRQPVVGSSKQQKCR